MGILYDDPEMDVELILTLCEEACDDWNRQFGAKDNVHLSVKREGVDPISRVGGRIVALCFPESPSAFKRVGALLIMMCLHPFIIARKQGLDGMYTRPLAGEALRDFAVDFIVDTVPMALSLLDTQINGQWVGLDKWPGFLSEDFKSELVLFLRWLGNAELVTYSLGNPIYSDDRLARIILGTSLILEASYARLPSNN